MIERTLPQTLKTSLKNNDPFIYFHLVKFEKPKPSSKIGNTAELPTDYAYITDAGFNVDWDNTEAFTAEGVAHGTQTYVANKLISVGTVQESTEARASMLSLKLSSNALNTICVNAIVTVDPSGFFYTDIDLRDLGFGEGDKVSYGNGSQYIRFDKFGQNPSSDLPNTKVYYTDIEGGPFTSMTTGFTLVSEEISALTIEKDSDLYSNYINRTVYIYKAHADPATGEMIGGPFPLFKGIISQATIDEDPARGSTITWGLSSHWGDFVRVQGRITSDESHRALDISGKSDETALIRPEYAYDYGFMHADKSINVLGVYQTQEERYKMVRRGGFAGWMGGRKLKTYYETVDNEVDLRFDLAAKYIPIVYGVQKVSAIPVFADTSTLTVSDRGGVENSVDLYVAYALCEGPIAGIYDIHIDDQPTVCSDIIDYDNRSWGSASSEDIDVVCFGRADKGYVLKGTPYVDSQNQQYARETWLEEDIADLNMNAGVFRNAYNRNINPYAPSDSAEGDGAAEGITHETSYTFNTPMNASITLHSGKPDQAADAVILEKASKAEFKVQTSYWQGEVSNYWSTSHMLLDTAYVSNNYIITADQESIPSYGYVVKGKFVDCYNYDGSYKVIDFDTGFNLGDLVDIYITEPDGTAIVKRHSNVQVVDKWQEPDENETNTTRYRFGTNYPDGSGDCLVDLSNPGFDDATRIKVVGAGGAFGSTPYVDAVTWDYSAPDSGVVAGKYSTIVGQADTQLINGFNGLKINLSNVNNDLHLYLSAVGHERIIGLEAVPGYYFAVESYSTDEITLAAHTAAVDLLSDADLDGTKVYIANAIYATDTSDVSVGSKVAVVRFIDGVKYESEKVVRSKIDTYNLLFTGTAFESSLVPGLNIGDFSAIATDTYDVRTGADKRVTINPAMQLLDYMSSSRYGRNLDINEEINLSTFKASARLCDDRSKVTVVSTTALDTETDGGDYYNYTIGGELIFQGRISSVTSHVYNSTTYYEVVFDSVIGKLGHKWNNWKNDWIVGEPVWKDDSVYAAPNTGPITIASFGSPLTTITLTKNGGVTPLVVSLDRLGGVSKTNPIVRSWSDTDLAFSKVGYSLYDSDDVKYWKYVGWNAQEQRYVTRHQINQVIETSTSIFDNINSMLGQFNGMLRYTGGLYELDIRTGAPRILDDQDPEYDWEEGVDRISEVDIIGGIKLEDKGQKGSFNGLSANIVDPQNGFNSKGVSYFNSDYLKEDKGVPKRTSFNMPGISNYYNARMNIVQFLNESRYGITAKFKMDPKGFILVAGKTMAISYARLGWTDRLFRIKDLALEPDGLVSLTVTEHNDSAYLVEYSDRTSLDNSRVGTDTYNRPTIDSPTGLTATGNRIGQVILNWTNPSYITSDTEDVYEIKIYAAEALRNNELTPEQEALTYPNTSTDTLTDYDIGTKYARTVYDADPNESYKFMGNEFSRAQHIASVSGDSYAHDTIPPGEENTDFRVYFYWIRIVKKAQGTSKRIYSAIHPDITQLVDEQAPELGYITEGIKGVSYDTDLDITITNTNEDHTFPVSSEDTGAVPTYTLSGTDISLYTGDNIMRFAGLAGDSGTIVTPNSWEITSIVVPDTGPVGPDIDNGTVAVTTAADLGNPLNPDNTVAEVAEHSALQDTVDNVILTFNISGLKEDGTEFTTTATQTLHRGIPGAPAVTLLSDVGIVTYDSYGENPVPNEVYLTSVPYNIEVPMYRYTDLTDTAVITDGVNDWTLLSTNIWEAPILVEGPHELQVEIADYTANGSDLTTNPAEILASDTVRVALLAGGAVGLNAISIFNSNSNHTIADTPTGLVYTDSGTTIKVYEGNTALTLLGPLDSLTPGTWQFQSIVASPALASGGIADSININDVYTFPATSAAIGDHSELLVSAVTIIYTIDIMRIDGTTVNNLETTQSIDKKPQAVNIFSNVANISYGSGWTGPSPSTIDITTSQTGFENPEYNFVLTRSGETTLHYPGSGTYSSASEWLDIPVADSQYDISVTVTAREVNDNTISDTDTLIIPATRDGTDGTSPITGLLTNQVHILTTGTTTGDYVLPDPAAGGTFKVYDGIDLVSPADVTFSVLNEDATTPTPTNSLTINGIKLTIDQLTGVYTPTDNPGLPELPGDPNNGAAFTLRAEYGGKTIDTSYIIYIRVGDKSLSISSTDQLFKYDTDGVLIGPSEITFTATQVGSEATIYWFTDYYNGTNWVHTPTNYMTPNQTGIAADIPTTEPWTSVLTEADFAAAGYPALRVWAHFQDQGQDFYIDTTTIRKVQDGEQGPQGPEGPDGYNTATLLVYRRYPTEPTSINKPTSNLTYTFSTAGWSWTTSNSWTKDIPTGTDPLWVRAATAFSNTPTDIVYTTDWSGASKLAADGSTGDSGLNSATVYIYQRTTTATAPSSVPTTTATYTFATGNTTNLNNSWTDDIPAESNGKYLWITLATASGTGTTDTISTGEWQPIRLLSIEGEDGISSWITASNGVSATKDGNTGVWSPDFEVGTTITTLTCHFSTNEFLSMGVNLDPVTGLLSSNSLSVEDITAVVTGNNSQALTITFTYDNGVHPAVTVAETVTTTVGGEDAYTVGAELATAGAETYSWVKTDSTWEPTEATAYITSKVYKGGVYQNLYKQAQITRDATTGMITTAITGGGHADISVTFSHTSGTSKAMTVTFTHTPSGASIDKTFTTTLVTTGGGTSSPVVSIQGGSASQTTASPANASVRWGFSNTAPTYWEYKHSGETLPNIEKWLLSGSPADYEIRASLVSGTTPTSGTMDSWQTCNSSLRYWDLETSADETLTCTLFIQIRDATSRAVLATGNVYLQAQRV